ncbi:MAG TPA: SgcJ/EcaC family oxidoreductase [Vicinamibacterales bacterium]|nr:SgcJ/EcaC family oxidoreductase [Vicinamibacterales bacterium]
MQCRPSICVALIAVLALVASCTPPPASPPRPDESALRSTLSAELAKFGPAFAAKDAAAIAAMFTDDGVWILPDASTYTGRTAIEAGAKAFISTFPPATMGPVTIDRLVVISDSEALTFSHGDYTSTEPGKPPQKHLNPFADYWKKGSDGAWRIAYEVNADGPAPQAGSNK